MKTILSEVYKDGDKQIIKGICKRITGDIMLLAGLTDLELDSDIFSHATYEKKMAFVQSHVLFFLTDLFQ